MIIKLFLKVVRFILFADLLYCKVPTYKFYHRLLINHILSSLLSHVRFIKNKGEINSPCFFKHIHVPQHLSTDYSATSHPSCPCTALPYQNQ